MNLFILVAGKQTILFTEFHLLAIIAKCLFAPNVFRLFIEVRNPVVRIAGSVSKRLGKNLEMTLFFFAGLLILPGL